MKKHINAYPIILTIQPSLEMIDFFKNSKINKVSRASETFEIKEISVFTL